MRYFVPTAALVFAFSLPTHAAAPASGKGAVGETYFQYLSRDAIAADAFTKAHPTWDGRGVVIAILDTGVDVSVPGLTSLPQGGVKVIEARDFSGQGDIALVKAEIGTDNGITTLRGDSKDAKGIVLTGHQKLSTKPADGTWWIGRFDEKRLENSDVQDINGNGSKNDVFGVVAFQPAGSKEAMFAIDLDGDGEIGDELVRPSFRIDQKHFRFGNPDPRKNQPPVAVTGTVLLDESPKRVELHFDDGGHGSHCAGISAGHKIQGKAGFDGIAPGAWVMSLKIGDNTNAGGATTPGSKKRAFEYAAKWAKDKGVPVIISLSYGIGSEIEGDSDVDKLMTSILESNPLVVASVAAGNEGPGISTIGTPGASPRVFTSGALLTKKNAEALWGGKVGGHRIFGFSSRGGELNKPDAVSPGVAWSTVPPFLSRSVMAGTSMATPQSSGAHALLLSAALAEKVAWNSNTLKVAFRASAKPVKGYSSLDVGAGLLHVPSAWTVLKKLGAKVARTKLHVGWDVATPTAHKPGTKGATASYWRVGSYIPEYPEMVTFTVKPAFFKGATDRAKKEFFDTLKISSDSGWLRADRSSLGMRGAGGNKVSARIDAGKLRGKPGVHVGHLRAKSATTGVEELTLPVVVVVPHTFATPQTRTRQLKGRLEAGGISRVFVEVPAGASTMELELGAPDGKFGYTFLEVHDPDGRQVGWGRANSKVGSRFKTSYSAKDLKPGVWEIVTYATFRNQQASDWELDVRFRSVSVPKALAYTLAAGKGPTASLMLTQRFSTPFVGSASANLKGYGKHHTWKVEGHEKTFTFTVGPNEKAVEFDLEVTGTDYNKFTDIAIMALSGGKAVVKSGFGNRFAHVMVRGPGTYTLKIIGATAKGRAAKPNWTLKVHQIHLHAAPVALKVSHPGGALALYPGVATKVELSAAKPFAEVPSGFHRVGTLTLKERKGGAIWLKTDLAFTKQK